ncbi:MAG: ATP-dependent Clp protease ATP-binding subunit ClpE [Variibacter sp.]|nr:ATP-dependent Clp protease ATP-binding subunit ClpE [Variibacter sp.]
MDVLDRLTNKAALEQAYGAKSGQLTVINAEELAANLKGKVIGQNEVIDQLCRTLRRRIAAKRPNKPIAVFCFAGPPGVGKTHLAKMLAEQLFQSKNNLHFFDMTQCMQPHNANTLFGSPKGYVGSGSYGALTAALRDVPNSIVLLDEIEKAHPDVHKRFLTAWNDGFVVESSDGSKIPTHETIFIMTTNAASRRIGEFARDHKGTQEELDRVAKSMLADAQFAPEVLSRIDAVFAFREMKGLDIARIVALEIESKTKEYGLQIADGGIDAQILLASIDKITKDGAKGGVRDIARAIENQITDGLIDAKTDGATHVRLIADGDEVIVVPERDNPQQPKGDASSASTAAG